MTEDGFLAKMAQPGRQAVEVGGRTLRPGDRVRLLPSDSGDLLDRALAGRLATIEGIDEDDAGEVHVAVTLDDDPGRDLGDLRHPAHRFFFRRGELEPVDDQRDGAPLPRILVAGIGNVFFGDDGFGVAVARRLLADCPPPGVEVRELGIRGMDLVFALQRPFDAAIIVDAVPRGRPPGSVFVLEPDEGTPGASTVDVHRMDPMAVIQIARRMGPLPRRLLILGCEPGRVGDTADPASMSMELSPPVAAAVGEAASLIVELASELLAGVAADGGRS